MLLGHIAKGNVLLCNLAAVQRAAGNHTDITLVPFALCVLNKEDACARHPGRIVTSNSDKNEDISNYCYKVTMFGSSFGYSNLNVVWHSSRLCVNLIYVLLEPEAYASSSSSY